MDIPNSHSDSQPTFADLLDYAEGRLHGDDLRRVETALASLPEGVVAEWEWVQRFVATSRTPPLHALPAGLEDRLMAVYSGAFGSSMADTVRGWMGDIRRVVAEWVGADEEADFAAMALRFKSLDAPRLQWTFKTPEMEISLNAVERPEQGYDLHGQVFAMTQSTPMDRVAQVLREDREIAVSTVDEFGEFVLKGLGAGDYLLILTDGLTEVSCSPLSVGGDPSPADGGITRR
jgi:hypothetical protein